MAELTRVAHSLLSIPEWMFVERPHIASTDPAKVRWACNVCGIIEPKECANGYTRRTCPCERAAWEAQSHGMLVTGTKQLVEGKRASRTYTWLGKDAEEVGLEQKTFTNFERKYQLEAYTKAHWYASQLVQRQPAGNLLLMGSYGTGKTHLAAAILNVLREQHIACLFCTVQNLFNALYAADFDDKMEMLGQVSSTPLLVLDELDKLHMRKDTDGAFQKQTLFDILNKRYKRQLPTIITTNEQNDLSPWLDGAAISRLYEQMTALTMNGVDYRLAKRDKPIRGN